MSPLLMTAMQFVRRSWSSVGTGGVRDDEDPGRPLCAAGRHPRGVAEMSYGPQITYAVTVSPLVESANWTDHPVAWPEVTSAFAALIGALR